MTATPIPATGAGAKPERQFRAGSIRAAIWRNIGTTTDGKPTVYRTVTWERRYKNARTQEWHSTHSLHRDDLPKAQLVLGKVYEFLMLADDASPRRHGDAPAPAPSARSEETSEEVQGAF